MNLQNYLQKQTKTRVRLLAVGLAVLTAGLEYWSGPQFSFTLFFLLPIAVASWFAGQRAGVIIAIFCAVLMALATKLWSLAPPPFEVQIWNAAIRCGIFLILALVLDKLKTAYASLEQQVADRTAKLTAEITKRQQAEAAAKLQFAQVAMDKMLDAAYWVRADGRFVYTNDAACKQLGYTRAELLELGVHDVDADIPAEQFSQVWRELQREKHRVFEARHRTKAGQLIPVELTVSYLENDGIGYLCGVARDLTARRQTEAALRDSEQKYRRLHESARDALVSVDMQGHILESNPAYQNLLGYSAAELRQLTYIDLTPAQWHAPEAKIVTDQLFPLGHSQIYEKEYRRKDGTLVPVELRMVLLRDDAGQPSGMWAIVRDITERKRTEAALRESAARMAMFADATFEGIVESTAGRILDCNEQFAQILHYSAAELKGMEIVNLIAPEDRDRVMEGIRQNREAGCEHTLIRKDGTRIFVETHGRPLALNSLVRHTSLRDINSRKQAEIALRESEERLRAVLDNSLDLIYRRNIQTDRYDFISPSALTTTGYSSDEMVGSSSQLAVVNVHPADRPQVEAILQQAQTGVIASGSVEYRFRHKDGRYRWLSDRFTILKDAAGRPLYWLGVSRDVTLTKEMEQALRQNEDRLRRLLEHSPDAVSIVDAKGQTLWTTTAATRLLGYSPAEFAKRPLYTLVHPDDLENYRALQIQTLAKPGAFVSGVSRLQHKDGSWRWIEGYATNLLAEPSIGGIVINYRDISERKEFAAALADSELRYRTLFEQAADVIVLFDAQTLDFLDFNDEAHRRLGYTRAEFAKLKIPDFEVLESAADVDRRVRNIPVDQTVEFETKQRTKTGAILDVAVRAKNIRLRDRNCVLGVWRDVTERNRVQTALRDEREKLKLAVEGSHGVPWEIQIDPTQTALVADTVNWGSQLKSFIGFRDDEFPNSVSAWFARIHPDDLVALRANGQAIFDGQAAAHNIEYRIRHKDGSWRWISSQRRLFRAPDGRAIRWSGIDWDITDHKRADEALQKSEARFRQLAEALPQGVWTRTASGEPEYRNQSLQNYLGEMKVASVAEEHQWAVHPDDLARVRAAWNQALATRTHYEIELRIRRHDGQYRWFLSRAVPLIDDRGAVIRWLGTSTDIEPQKQAEAVLRRSQAELERLLEERTQRLQQTQQWLQKIYDSSQDAIVVSETTGPVVEFNQAFETLLGYSAEEIRQLTFYQLTPPEFLELNHRIIDKIVRTGETARFEKEYFRKDGTRVPVALTIWPIPDRAGRFTKLAAIVSDVTEQHRLQREILEVSEHERRRIGQDLHDSLCQMLTATTFAVGALEERLAKNNPPAAQSTHEIGELIRRANGEARNISRGLYPIELEAGGLVAALQRLADEITRAGKARCEFLCDADVRVTNQMQALHIYRIAQEAVANAQRHGSATTIVIVLKLAHDQVVLEVSNNGHDWPLELAEPGAARGMGLTIMAYRARMIGGTLQVCRGSHGGTMVELSFPIPRSHEK